MPIDQLAIMLTGVISAWVLNAPTERVRRWGCIIGLIGQPAWFWSTWSHAQWGMFAVTVGYTAAFMRGVWSLWVSPHLDTKKRGASSNIAAGQKIMANKAARILYQYGDLLRFSYQVTGGELRVGTNDHKAAWHHFGTGTHGEGKGPYTIRPKNRKALAFGGGVFSRATHPGVPARRLVGFPAGDQSIAARIVAEHLATAAAQK